MIREIPYNHQASHLWGFLFVGLCVDLILLTYFNKVELEVSIDNKIHVIHLLTTIIF